MRERVLCARSIKRVEKEILRGDYGHGWKKLSFCKNVAVNRCKDTRFSAQKGRYSTSTGSSVLKRHVESCLAMDLDCDRSLKKVKDHGEA